MKMLPEIKMLIDVYYNTNNTSLTATYKTSELKEKKFTLLLSKKFADDKRDSIKIDFTRFIIEKIMEKYEDEPGCDGDLLVVFPEDAQHPIHAQEAWKGDSYGII